MAFSITHCVLQVNFEQDNIVSQANEYEVLQLLMADMRDRLTAYPGVHLFMEELRINQSWSGTRAFASACLKNAESAMGFLP